MSYFRPLVTDKNNWAEIKISEKIQTSFCETAFGLLKRQTKVSQFEQHIIKHIYKVKGSKSWTAWHTNNQQGMCLRKLFTELKSLLIRKLHELSEVGCIIGCAIKDLWGLWANS